MKKIDLSGIDPQIDPEAAQSYIDHRIGKKKPLTQRAFNLAMKKALKAPEVGMTPTELIDWTVDKGWDGINLNFTKSALGREMQAIKSLGVNNDILDNTSWDDGHGVSQSNVKAINGNLPGVEIISTRKPKRLS